MNTLPNIEFDLHDSQIHSISIAPDGDIQLNVALYEIFYEDHPNVELVFGGVRNAEKVERFAKELTDELLADEEFSWRIEAFHYDMKKPSTCDDLFFYLKVEHTAGIRIHCSKFQVMRFNREQAP